MPFLARLARKIDQVAYFKIETPQTAAKLRGLIAAGGDAIEGPFDGEEAITLLADLDAGATGTMPSALVPDLLKPIVEAHRAGRRDEAAAAYARVLPLVNFENRQAGLRALQGRDAGRGRHPVRPCAGAARPARSGGPGGAHGNSSGPSTRSCSAGAGEAGRVRAPGPPSPRSRYRPDPCGPMR